MKKLKGFEQYPAWMVLVINLISLSVYLSGLYLLYLVWPLFAILFLFYLIYLEFSLYSKGCMHCYYYGKRCAFGRGSIASLFFRRGNPRKFCEREFSIKDFIPSSLVTIIPLVAGIYLLVMSFNWLIILLMAWPLIVMFFGNPITYGRLACPNCRQAELCCPASKFFMKKAKKR